MAQTRNITQGMIIRHNNEPHLILKKEFYAPGRGYGITKTKIKSLISGKVVTQTFRSNEKVEEVDVTSRTMQFIYVDGDDAIFMDPKTFEQISITLENVPDGQDYLHTESKYVTMFYEGNPISVQLPKKIKLKVEGTTDAVKGNTSGGATKEAVLETGAKIQVPLFIKEGESVMVNTESGAYVEKA